jgi:hypothetical protein
MGTGDRQFRHRGQQETRESTGLGSGHSASSSRNDLWQRAAREREQQTQGDVLTGRYNLPWLHRIESNPMTSDGQARARRMLTDSTVDFEAAPQEARTQRETQAQQSSSSQTRASRAYDAPVRTTQPPTDTSRGPSDHAWSTWLQDLRVSGPYVTALRAALCKTQEDVRRYLAQDPDFFQNCVKELQKDQPQSHYRQPPTSQIDASSSSQTQTSRAYDAPVRTTQPPTDTSKGPSDRAWSNWLQDLRASGPYVTALRAALCKTQEDVRRYLAQDPDSFQNCVEELQKDQQ